MLVGEAGSALLEHFPDRFSSLAALHQLGKTLAGSNPRQAKFENEGWSGL